MFKRNLTAIAGALLIGMVTAPALAQGAEPQVAKEDAVMTARAKPTNAAPLGLELGYANIKGTKAALAALGVDDFRSEGDSKYTGGPMFASSAQGLQINGLKSVFFIFSKDEILHGVVLTFNKDAVGMAKNLASKYKRISSNINSHMNYGEARFEQGESIIDIMAPHLSFDMDVQYKTKAFENAYQSTLKEEKKAAKQRQDNLL